MSVKFQSTAACLSVIAVLILSGCSAENVEAKSDSGKVVLNIPDSNLYKAEITETFNASKSSFVRKVLADGVATEAEYAESKSRYVTCFKKFGLKATVEGGALNLESLEGRDVAADNFEKAREECEAFTGYRDIYTTFDLAKFNPDKENPVEAMLKCLKMRDVLEQDVTLAEFEPQYDDWGYMDAHRKDFDECYADPDFFKRQR